jgi:hypothetical protein
VSLQPGITSDAVPVVATTRTKDQSIPENNKKTFKLAKDFLAIHLFTKNPWPLTRNKNMSLSQRAGTDQFRLRIDRGGSPVHRKTVHGYVSKPVAPQMT